MINKQSIDFYGAEKKCILISNEEEMVGFNFSLFQMSLCVYINANSFANYDFFRSCSRTITFSFF